MGSVAPTDDADAPYKNNPYKNNKITGVRRASHSRGCGLAGSMKTETRYRSLGRMKVGTARRMAVCVGLVGAVGSASAIAQLTHNITLGNPKALGLANAVTADPPGIDSIHFNPAGLAKIKGRERSFKVIAAHMTLEGDVGHQHTDALEQSFEDTYCGETRDCFQRDPLENTHSSTSAPTVMLPGSGVKSIPAMIVPFGGIAFEDPDYGWTFATAVYSPEAIGYERDEDDPAAFQGYKVSTTRLTYFSPSLGVEITDNLMLGASLGMSWQGLGVHTKFRAPEQTLQFVAGTFDQEAVSQVMQLSLLGPYDNVGNVSIEMEDPLSLTFNLGVLWEVTPWLALGAVYQSEGTSEMEGDYRMENTPEFQETTQEIASTAALSMLISALSHADINNQPVESGKVTMEYTTPQSFAVGASVRVVPRLKLNADVKWIEYSVWDSLDFHFSNTVDFLTIGSAIEALAGEDDADPNELRMPRNYQDVWSYAVGAEYQYDDTRVLRAGFEPRASAIPKGSLDFLVPIADADLYTVGAGWLLDKFTRLDIAFGYMASSFEAKSGESHNANATKAGDVVYNPYAYLDVSAKTTAYLFTLSYDQRF